MIESEVERAIIEETNRLIAAKQRENAEFSGDEERGIMEVDDLLDKGELIGTDYILSLREEPQFALFENQEPSK